MSAMPSRWNKLGQLRCFTDDRKALSLLDLCAFFAAFRFSARLWSPGRGTQTCQQFVHPAPHLLRGWLALLAFPRTQFHFDQVAGQHQMVVCNGDNVTPTLKLLWGPQTWGFPQQRLFVKTVAMLLPKATNISQANLCDIGLWVAYPGKPTDTRVAFFVSGMRTHDANDRQVQPTCLLDMHLLPPGDFHGATFVISAAPHAIWISMSGAILGLQLRSIFAWTPLFARWRRCWPIETPIVFETTRDSNAQCATLTPQPVGIIAPIQYHDGVLGQMGDQPFELGVSHPDGRCLRCHPLLIQDVGPTTGRFRQDHHRRKLPAKGDWFLAFWQIMHVLSSSLCRSHCIRTCNVTRIYPYPQPLACIWFRQIVGKDFSQALVINTPILKRCIQARPFALKPQRLRHFGKRFRLRFRHQGIDGIEQGVFRSQKTVMDIVTKLSQCVNVFQTSKLPLFDDRNFTRLGRPPQGWGAFCLR